MWKDSYAEDYRVDISYAAYWIKNLLFIFEKGILTFQTKLVLEFILSLLALFK